jgi:esterase/lipase superfamily enzyme
LNIDEINKFIPYLASQFTENNFKRLQIVITIDAKANFLRNTGPLEEDGRKILPKSI